MKREQTGFNRERRFKYQLLFSSLKMGIILDQQNYLSCSFSPCFQFWSWISKKTKKVSIRIVNVNKKSEFRRKSSGQSKVKSLLSFILQMVHAYTCIYEQISLTKTSTTCWEGITACMHNTFYCTQTYKQKNIIIKWATEPRV